MGKQQDILDVFYTEIIAAVGTELGNRVYDGMAPDDATLPLATYNVITDIDINLLGNDVINDTNLQVSFFAKKSLGVSTIRNISDTFVEYVHGLRLSNGMLSKVVNKGITLIEDTNDETVQILTEVQIS